MWRDGATSPEYPGGTAEDFGEDPLGDSVAETWLLPQADVGDTVTSYVGMRSVCGLPGERMDVLCDVENIDFYGGASDKDVWLVINSLVYRNDLNLTIVGPGGANAAHFDDADGDGRLTIHDLALYGISNLPVPNGDYTTLDMTVTFSPPPEIANDYQGDMTNMTLIFNLK